MDPSLKDLATRFKVNLPTTMKTVAAAIGFDEKPISLRAMWDFVTPIKHVNLLFDSWCSQVLFQQAPPKSSAYPTGYPPGFSGLDTGMRLNTLFGAIKSIGQTCTPGLPWNIAFTKPPITDAQLDGVSVYISLTRYKDAGFEYGKAELSAIQSWVNSGGNVLLMTNHGALPSDPADDWTVNDAPLAALFGVTLKNYFVSATKKNPSMVIAVVDSAVKDNAPTIMAHDACIITVAPPSGVTVTTIAKFPPGWVAWSTSAPCIAPPSKYFALRLPISSTPGVGQLLLVGNSGWVADEGSPNPAPGLAPVQSNLQFVLNCIGYLAGVKMPSLGSGIICHGLGKLT